MSNLIMRRVNGVSTTTDATPTVVASFTLPSNCSAYVQAMVSGRNTTGGDSISGFRVGTAKNVSGTASVVGTVANLVTANDVSLVTAAFSIVASGADVQVQVTGIAATTIEWFCWLELWIN